MTDSLRIIFELAGGCFDGKTVCSDSDDQKEADEAHAYYRLTALGTIGKRFWGASDYARDVLNSWPENYLQDETFQPHVYEVTGRIDGDGEVLIRAEYRPELRSEALPVDC